jgi:hypothetical protein
VYPQTDSSRAVRITRTKQTRKRRHSLTAFNIIRSLAMLQTNNILKAAVAASCLAAVAACGDNGSTGSNTAAAATVSNAEMRAIPATAGTTSISGTTIPSATQIIDSTGNVWTVSAGVISENGALAGYTKNVKLLLYVNNTISQENTAGGWWSWIKGAWAASSDPRTVVSANGTSIPAATQIIDSSGNVWVVSGGVIYKNGVLAGYSNAVAQLVYDNKTIYQDNTAGAWWSWNGTTWVSSTDPVGGNTVLTMSGTPSASDATGEAYSFVPTTSNTGGGTLTFSIANKPTWASYNTATGALTGTPSSAQAAMYSNIQLSVSNGSASASIPVFSINVTTGFANLTWSAPTENTDGTPLTDLSGYTIYYGTEPGEMTQTILVAAASANSYEVNNLPSGTYYFAIAANASDGTQSAQSSAGSKAVL